MGNNSTMCGQHQGGLNGDQLEVSSSSDEGVKRVVAIERIKNKPVFHKVSQIALQSEEFPCQIVLTEDNLVQNDKQSSLDLRLKAGEHDEKEEIIWNCPTLEEIMMQEEQKLQMRKIGVNWNSFVKIKKKNYLQDYIFQKQIGRGAYGSVNKIKMKYGGMDRAAKVIKSSLITAEKQNLGKLFAQISVPMRMDHPNLVKLFQVFDNRGQYVLILELCEGGDLFSYIKQNRFFSQSKAATIIKQILSAVNYMHKQGVMHRDLKPQNVLVDAENDTLKIGDFGTATPFNADSRFSDLVGTPYYVAPEVISGNYTEKCDVWSCGVILYILLCGAPPFNGKSDKEILQKIRCKPLDFRSSVWKKRNKFGKELIIRMLAKNPQERITAEQALNSEWLTNVSQMASKQKRQEVEIQVVKNLQSFHFKNKLKAVVYTYIASQLYSNNDKNHLLQVFRQIDKDGDGVIEKNELISIFNSHSRSRLSDIEIQSILQLIDTNGSGRIDFTQFLVAASNEEKMLQEKRLENAFNYLDADHSGYITIQEVKAFLDGTSQTNEQIKKIFDEVDQNGDGQISKEEFISLLLKKD